MLNGMERWGLRGQCPDRPGTATAVGPAAKPIEPLCLGTHSLENEAEGVRLACRRNCLQMQDLREPAEASCAERMMRVSRTNAARLTVV